MTSSANKTTRKVAPFNGLHDVHQQEYGNWNYVLVNKDTGKVYDDGPVFTVFTKDDTCGRGEYLEELDIQLSSRQRRKPTGVVKRIAEAVLKAEYQEGLRVSKLVERFGLFM